MFPRGSMEQAGVSDPQQDGGADLETRERALAHFGFNFVLDVASDGLAGLRPLDCLLIMAVNQANIGPLTRDPDARSRYGALGAPAPDEARRPVSVRAVAASMRLPYETARRHVRRLETRGACQVSEAGVVVPAAFLAGPAYVDGARAWHERLRNLHRLLQSRGLLDPPPTPHYDEREPPVRGAVRLMSDYLLRTAEALVGRTGDLVSGLLLLPLLAASANVERAPAPMAVAALARRVQLPAETVRRHALELVEAGLCEIGPKGAGLVASVLTAPEWRSLLRDNAVAVQRLFAGLAERGVIAAWERADAANGGDTRGAA